jgi:hypothetical protein
MHPFLLTACSLLSAAFPSAHWPTLSLSLSQALGGLVVGLVTKYAGGVVKGFALIAGETPHKPHNVHPFHCPSHFTLCHQPSEYVYI